MTRFYGSDGRWRAIPSLNLEAFTDNERTAYAMGALAFDAAASALADFRLVLDYSPESMAGLEIVLAGIHRNQPDEFLTRLRQDGTGEDEVYQTALPWGGYLGEVLRLNLGALWVLEHPMAPGQQGNFMSICGKLVDPVLKVCRRITDGPGDNVDRYFKVLAEVALSGTGDGDAEA